MADFEPSPCPILDLGVKLEPRDPRDPWRRMPDLFALCKGIFGGGMMRHEGQVRSQVESRLGHYCKCTREAHGACTQRRAKLCQDALATEIQAAAFAPKGQEYAFMQHRITSLLRSERHHAALKATEVPVTRDLVAGGGLAMPPITLQAMPEGE